MPSTGTDSSGAYRAVAAALASLVLILALVVLYGWATAQYGFTQLIPSFGGAIRSAGKIHSAAAFNLVLISIALLMSMSGLRGVKLASSALATLTALSCALAAYVSLSGSTLDNIRLLAPDPSAPGITYPTPVIPDVAITLGLLALALLFARTDWKQNLSVGDAIVGATMIIPMLILLGTAFGSYQLCSLGGCIKASVAFAIISLLLATAMLLSRPDHGFARMLTVDSAAGALIRRAYIFLSIAPALCIGVTIAKNTEIGGYPLLDPEAGGPVLVFILIGFVGSLAVTGARTIKQVEEQRSELSQKLSQVEAERKRFESQLITVEQELDSISGDTIVSPSTTFAKYKRVCLVCTEEFDDTIEVCPTDSSPLTRVPDESLEGVVFLDKYQISHALGEGGMSVVYKARHRLLDQDYAIKVLKDSTASRSDGFKRFHREAKATSALKHEGIVTVHDFGLSPAGRAFIVMDYLEGESLLDLLQREGKLDLSTVSGLVDQLCSALEHAHQMGVVHRDLKPGNIMLIRDGLNLRAKIVDFGLAKLIDDGSTEIQQLTRSGECFGSPMYMSPEQCSGQPVDYRTDIYAMGCILYECITGRHVFQGKNIIETFKLHVSATPQPIPQDLGVPPEVEMAIYKALNKFPMDRQKSLLQLRDTFLSYVGV